MLLQAPTRKDLEEWQTALRKHMIETMKCRSDLFEHRLEREGVKVPRGTILMSDDAAPLMQMSKEQMEAIREEDEEERKDELFAQV